MQQLNEVARMQQLAGINEIKIQKPNTKIIKYQDGNYYFKLDNDVLKGFLDDEDEDNTPTFAFHNLTDEQREKFLNLFDDDEIVYYDEENNWFMILKDAFKII